MLNSNVKIIKHKVGLLNLAEELGNVSKACKVMGLSRDTFYRYKSAVDEHSRHMRFYSVPNRNNHIQIVKFNITSNIALTFSLGSV